MCILSLARFRIVVALTAATAFVACCDTTSTAEEPAEYLIGYMGVGDNGSGVAHVLGFIKPDGTGERYPEFGKPNQQSWVFGPLFSDGRRIVLTSLEDTDVKSVRAGKVVSHDWIYDIFTGELQPALEQDRQAQQLRPYALLPGEERIIETAYIGNEERIFIKDLDGRNARELTAAGGGFHYALELSHDGGRLTCHVTGGAPAFYNPGMYSINVFELDSGERTLVAGQPGHLMFGPRWSPDDHSLAYLDCLALEDPAHFRADLAIGRADGSEHRAITGGSTALVRHTVRFEHDRMVAGRADDHVHAAAGEIKTGHERRRFAALPVEPADRCCHRTDTGAGGRLGLPRGRGRRRETGSCSPVPGSTRRVNSGSCTRTDPSRSD